MRIKLGIPLSLKEIAKAVGYETEREVLISHISTDTREINTGDLFWAISGRTQDVSKYTEQARAMGCYTLSSEGNADIEIQNTADGLLKLAAYYKSKLEKLIYTVGITGSVGKTTTKEFLKVILSAAYKVHATEGNYNNNIGMPLTVLSAPTDTEILILEMGMNHLGEISALSKCINPDIGVITNIGTAHIGLLGSRENIAEAKLEILDGMSGGVLVIPYGEQLLKGIPNSLTFSNHTGKADVVIRRSSKETLCIETDAWSECEVPFKIQGVQFEECLAAAIAVCHRICLSSRLIKLGVSRISSENVRQNTIRVGNIYIYDDSYNASFESVLADFDLLSTSYINFPTSILIGTVLELGEYSADIHYKIGLAASRYNFRRLFFLGEYALVMAKGAILGGVDAKRIFINGDLSKPEITAEQMLSERITDETILFKASNKVKLSRVIEILKERLEYGDYG